VSLDQLRYFVAVADAGTMHAAARWLHVSQPPLSRHIRALEDEIGVPLFARSSRGMRLLPAGEVLLGRARTILAALDDAVRATRGDPHEPASSSAPSSSPVVRSIKS
jgi:DNA-binding transcriptional LysR family regulator